VTGLDHPEKKQIALQIVASNELVPDDGDPLDWRTQFEYIEDIGDDRGYTAGIVGFTSATGDMLDLVRHYTTLRPDNVLAPPVLEAVLGSASHAGLGPAFERDWKAAATDQPFQQAQEDERDRVYLNPAVAQGNADGLDALGQFIYYDALVMHGPGDEFPSFAGIRDRALEQAQPPTQDGSEEEYLHAFLDARLEAMDTDGHSDNHDRVDTEQRAWLEDGNLALNPPLRWTVNEHEFECDGGGCRPVPSRSVRTSTALSH
jgi:chitosanase